MKAAQELAEPLVKLGYSTAKLIWISTSQPSLPEGMQPTVYSKLAVNLQRRIDEGRAAAQLAGANFDLIASTLTYVAVADPEPLTKATAGIAAFAAKKTGDFIVETAIKRSQEDVRAALASGLEESSLTDDELRSMTHEQIAAHVAEFKVGGQQIKEILDDPESLRLVQDHMIDIVSDNALEALRQTEIIGMSVDKVREDVQEARDEIDRVRTTVEERADRLENKMTELADTVTENTSRLMTLEQEVQENGRSLGSIAEISFSGWTTQQKLQAVRSDLFPDLTQEQTDAMIDSLVSQQKQEKLISEVSSIAGDLGSISAIASNLNMPPEIVQATNTASTIATGAAQFLSGNYLGAIQSITSLVGMGKPDPAAERHQQMMEYLNAQFAQINAQLENIIELQVKTIEALGQLRKEQQDFRIEVLGQLRRIESITLANNRILQALVRNQWSDCDALVSNITIGGLFEIKSREKLLEIMSESTLRQNAVACYLTMSTFLDARVLPFDWSGQVIAANAVPDELTPADEEVHVQLIRLEQLEERALRTAESLLLTALSQEEVRDKPARVLARIAQPVATVSVQKKYDSTLREPDFNQKLGSFKCNDTTTLSIALKELLCFEATSAAGPPSPDRLAHIFAAAMLGPQVERVIKGGVLLATFADLSFNNENDEMRLVKVADLEGIETRSLSQDLQAAIAGRNGLRLLVKLRRLADAYVLQQSLMYGDFTAQVAEEALYDKQTKTLNVAPTEPAAAVRAQAALEAMRANSVLARNVVLLALRHAIADAQGGVGEAEAANFLETEYGWAYGNFVRGDRCGNDEIALAGWKSMFPNWAIEYRASSAEKAEDTAKFANCPEAQTLDLGDDPKVGLGSGPSLKLTSDFYVPLPSSMEMSIGRFEQPLSLLRALALRDKVNQAIAERSMSETLDATVSDHQNRQAVIQRVSFDLLNAGLLQAR
ncbi:hypothetical protein CN198_14005 [Sinorhizobium meliloti]|uniref:hypothetical protein n=1 Tax=Rhizobium meliloti TaxID=382 RepID=UPI000FD8EEA2|nr:hypothetical protein [Sinorhizobium meliloti]RVH69176.1 hypothetical protein CN198_14005 [Sinorhizobium meliloti]